MLNSVFIFKSSIYSYPNKEESFSPSEKYPEYAYKSIAKKKNHVYNVVRTCFYEMGYDKEHYGTERWNPLKHLINKGDTVLIKPNMVLHENRNKEYGEDCLITHPSVVRVVLDYVLKALDGTGKVIIGDAPVQSCDFDVLIKKMGYDRLQEFYKEQGGDIQLRDFRNIRSRKSHGINLSSKSDTLSESITVNVGGGSPFKELSADQYKRLRITSYDPDIMIQHHNEKINEYSIAKEVLEADVIINMPKPKTHRKAGLTISLKNMVGINTNKEWLPHHMVGSPEEGGDEYKTKSFLKKLIAGCYDYENRNIAKHNILRAKCIHAACRILTFLNHFIDSDCLTEGNWSGNSTIWRMIYDLNRIVFFTDKKGVIRQDKQRRMLIIADMIVAGEGEGPLMPSPKETGIIAIGENPVCFDEAIATIMGYSPEKIPSILQAKRFNNGVFQNSEYPTTIYSNYNLWNNVSPNELKDSLVFKASKGWSELH